MKLINFEESSVKISLDKDELYIIQAIVGEIYSGVCVDCRDYDTWDKCQLGKVGTCCPPFAVY